MEIPLDQFFWSNMGTVDQISNMVPFLQWNPENFETFQKSTFFLSEWLQNRSKRSSALKFLAEMLKLAKKAHFCGFSANLVIFDQIWSRLNIPVPVVVKSKFSSRFIKYMSESPPGSLRFHCKWEKILRRSNLKFSEFFDQKKLVIFVPKKCKNALSVPLKS